MASIALLGGTGALGLGLGMRWAAAGEPLVIGSRSAERAEAAAESIRAAVPGAQVTGAPNDQAAAAGDPVVLCVPFEGLADLIAALRPALAGKVVVDAIVPLAFSKKFCGLEAIEGAASVSEWLQAALPDAKVVSAFKNLPAGTLQDLAQTLSTDALLCGDDKEARDRVAALTARIPGLHPLDAGDLRNARYLEALTALLVNLNRRHGGHGAMRVEGLGKH